MSNEPKHPEMDALLKVLEEHSTALWYSPLIQFGKNVEERLRAALQKIEDMEWRGIHSCHQNCQRPACIERRRLRIAEAALHEILEMDTDCAVMDLAAEAIKKIDEDRKSYEDKEGSD